MMMKKAVCLLTSLLVLISAFSLPVFAAGSASFSLACSSSQVRTGDTVTVTGRVSTSATIGAFDINVSYDSSKLKFTGGTYVSPNTNSGELDVVGHGSTIQVLYLDADGGNTGAKSGNIFKLTFTVIGGSVGSSITLNSSVTSVADATAGNMQGSGGSASMSIAAPLSGNDNLASLTVSNATISPAFSKNVTSYKTSVPFTVEKLNVSATAEDPTAKVSVYSPTLTPAATTSVTVTVTAQSGAKKTYTIQAARAQDPNYKPSSNSNLKGISVNPGILSPAFQNNVVSYVVWLPYEVTKISVTGATEDAKASVAVSGGDSLAVGDNTVTVVCTAENGSKKTYTVVARRAAAWGTTAPAPDYTGIQTALAAAGKSGAPSAVYVDLSKGQSSLPAAVFSSLKANKNAVLLLNLGGAQVTFHAGDITNPSAASSYDFGFKQGSAYQAAMEKAAGGAQNAFTYLFQYHGALPGYADFTIATQFAPGLTVNVYRYDNSTGKFTLIAGSVKVGAGGIVSYRNNTCSDYLITPTAIAGALKAETAARQASASASPLQNLKVVFLVAGGLLLLAAGFVIGIVVRTLTQRRY